MNNGLFLYIAANDDTMTLWTNRQFPPPNYRHPTPGEYEFYTTQKSILQRMYELQREDAKYRCDLRYKGPEHPADYGLNAGCISQRQPVADPPAEKARAREITIIEKDYGYVVTCGGQTLCIEKTSTLLDKLSKYLRDPKATELEYRDGKLF